MKHLDLFSGIGGFALAARWAGIETVGFCEKDAFCGRVLRKHWPDIPLYKNISELNDERLKRDGIKADIITGGFPCQPFSVAGKQRGEKDDRHLWPEMFRVVREHRPDWVVGENVTGFISMGIDQATSDLESGGYECRTFIIPAVAVDAPHKRERVWIVANRKGVQWEEIEWGKQDGIDASLVCKWREWPDMSDARRANHGVPCRVDRLRTLGNAIVPQVAYVILKLISSINCRMEVCSGQEKE